MISHFVVFGTWLEPGSRHFCQKPGAPTCAQWCHQSRRLLETAANLESPKTRIPHLTNIDGQDCVGDLKLTKVEKQSRGSMYGKTPKKPVLTKSGVSVGTPCIALPQPSKHSKVWTGSLYQLCLTIPKPPHTIARTQQMGHESTAAWLSTKWAAGAWVQEDRKKQRHHTIVCSPRISCMLEHSLYWSSLWQEHLLTCHRTVHRRSASVRSTNQTFEAFEVPRTRLSSDKQAVFFSLPLVFWCYPSLHAFSCLLMFFSFFSQQRTFLDGLFESLFSQKLSSGCADSWEATGTTTACQNLYVEKSVAHWTFVSQLSRLSSLERGNSFDNGHAHDNRHREG